MLLSMYVAVNFYLFIIIIIISRHIISHAACIHVELCMFAC